MAMNITAANFEQEVLKSDKPVLVDFWAGWCGPCKMLAPVIDEISAEVPGVKVVKVDIGENQQLAMQYGVMSIPTLILFRDGKAVGTSIGVRPKSEILAMLS